MKKVGIITFHASHNYGSMLQAYALQQTILRIGHNCKIINLRTKKQRKFYRPLVFSSVWQDRIKALLFPFLAYADLRKHHLFEQFLSNKLLTTTEIKTPELLNESALGFDIYVSGSDQIWNTCCPDYVSSFFLDFVYNHKKIAYAPSMGPCPDETISPELYGFIENALNSYCEISVREAGTADFVERITGKRPKICIDPTLLLEEEEWRLLAGSKPIISEDYMLFYSPFPTKEQCSELLLLSKRTGLKVILTTPNGTFRLIHKKSIKYHINVGPIEFLNLIRHAQFVISGSFHAVVFSIIFARPFYAIDGMSDNRVSSLLKLTKMECYAVRPNTIKDPDSCREDFNKAKQIILTAKEDSMLFLKSALV